MQGIKQAGSLDGKYVHCLMIDTLADMAPHLDPPSHQ